jgi:hypothetical protein
LKRNKPASVGLKPARLFFRARAVTIATDAKSSTATMIKAINTVIHHGTPALPAERCV